MADELQMNNSKFEIALVLSCTQISLKFKFVTTYTKFQSYTGAILHNKNV